MIFVRQARGVATFSSYDGTELAYLETGAGEPLICLPGGPLRPVGYLGDLGGLSVQRRLVLLEHRGNGASQKPADPGTFRIDRMVADVEALRRHLGLERMAVLGHSAGASLAMLYAAAHPERVSALVLVTPSPRALDVAPDPDDVRAAILARKHEPWFSDRVFEAYERLSEDAGQPADKVLFEPFWHGRWDTVAIENAFAPKWRIPEGGSALHYADGAFDPPRTRAALAALPAPVLMVAGELDFSPTVQHARRLVDAIGPKVALAVQPGAGHYPWEDDAAAFRATVGDWLARA